MFGNVRRIRDLLVASIVFASVGFVAVPPAHATAPPSQIVRSKIGGDGHPLTDQDSANIQPAWSPDGSHVVFASNLGGTYHLYEVTASGGDETQLTSGSWNDTHPVWSPDGTRLAFASDRSGNWNIFTMAPDGSDVRQVTQCASFDTQPAWSPDGSRIAFTSNRDGNLNIYTIGANGGTAVRVTTNGAADSQPAWSPGGSRIAFVSNRYGSSDIFTISPQGYGLHRLTWSVAMDAQPAWSPDGSSIAFSSNRSGYDNLWVVPAAGGTAQQATSEQATDGQPSWRPSGKAIAFSSAAAEPPSSAAWGIFSAPRGGLDGDQLISRLESEIGRQFSGERIYQNLSTVKIPTSDMLDLASKGGLIYLNINSFFVRGGHSFCARWADVAGGKYDAQLSRIAEEIIAFDYPIDLGYNHEMTNSVPHHPACGMPGDYVRAYNHIHALFDRLGVTIVTWVWTPTASSFIRHTAGQYLPSNFDVVGVDGYNRAGHWRSAAEIFTAAHAFALSHGKPLLIGEIGSDEWPGQPLRKAYWLQSAAHLFQSWSDLQGIMWTNTGADGHRFWLDSSTASLTMFRMAGVHFR
jgi:Tol biopolymer transport system component